MALSTFFNWDDTTLQSMNPEMSFYTFHEATPELAPDHLLAYSDHESFFFPNTFLLDSYSDPTPISFHHPEIYPHHLLPCTSADDPVISLSDIFPSEEYYNLLPCPKRQKFCFENQDQYSYLDYIPGDFVDGFVPNPCSSLPAEGLPKLLSAMLKVPLPLGNSGEYVDHCGKKTKEKKVSPQSIAARERRRKITEKTQDLGKLVPGGSKMNTAEMFHAAYKYVKYLQAQVGMLELMNTLQEDKASTPAEDLQALLVSSSVQEKLYLEEKCIVPEEFVTTLTNVQTTPSILKDLNQLTIATDTEKKKTLQI